ncbi:hypothetical protein GCM10007989_20820 [Devosia pacifica]|uniref:Carbohydrate ABC transporter substrate-binding protein (CUT1 family) n=1 Tax=Devosia pacifica TaxID=1335967 RepID=A0A918VSD1_9HYPH|nr:extracellular solute-binding protein [Devosia pacifica]GHA24993.1 hypothetical protein GCM10007989_20820 [Devosia pacifica]
MNSSKQVNVINRRELMAGVAAITAMAAVMGSRSAHAQEGTLAWWDHFQPLAELHERMWANYAAESGGVPVEHTVMNPSDMMQSLQLAFRSGEAPDVASIPDSLAVISQLLRAGRFASLTDAVSLDKPVQREALFDGMHIVDGEVYSFPIFSFRWHTTALWFHKQMLEEAGMDPDAGPRDWDQIAAAAQATTGNGRYGLLLPIQFTGRMEAHLDDLAQMAGGVGPIDWRTGQYTFAGDQYVEALEFLLSFQENGTLHPASSSLDARQGRVRWAAGEAAMFTDGPWNSGSLASNMPDVIDGIGVVTNPMRSAGSTMQVGPAAGTFWVTEQSQMREQASELLAMMTTDEYYVALAERMDQPPLDLSAVERADVHETYRTIVREYPETVRLAPEPLIRNPDIAQVYAQMRTVSPGLGEIIQGAFAGAVPDIRATLQEYQDAMTAERDRAISVARENGAQVSVDDWIFENWEQGTDFAPDQYS